VKFHAWFFGWNTDPNALDLAIRDAQASIDQLLEALHAAGLPEF